MSEAEQPPLPEPAREGETVAGPEVDEAAGGVEIDETLEHTDETEDDDEEGEEDEPEAEDDGEAV